MGFHLQIAEPEDACANLSVPVLDSKPWIALIKRSDRARTDCSFDIKVSKSPIGSPAYNVRRCWVAIWSTWRVCPIHGWT